MEYAALATWVVAAVLGAVMLTTWVSHGGARPDGGTTHFRPPVVLGHFLLAAAGLVVWLVYLADDSSTLAWVAFVDLVVVAALGETLVLRWSKDRSSAGVSARAGAAGVAGTAAPETQLAEQRFPTAVVGAHGLFAVATVVLVLLTALGVGGS
jgi:hypothetical protein